MESVTSVLKTPGACLVNANAAEVEKHCICPERGHGRLSSSSARHRRRVVDPSDPPGAVNVASETPTAAASTSHASSSSSSAHAPDGPVALLASVVIRKLRVDHRLEKRDDEVHDAPEHIREYARTHSRAPVHHRAVADVGHPRDVRADPSPRSYRTVSRSAPGARN